MLSDELLKMIVCPACKGQLKLSNDGQNLDCHTCKLSYPVQEGVPILLTSQARAIEDTAVETK